MSTLTRRSLALAITVIAALALAATACSDSDPDSTTTDTAGTTATSATPPEATETTSDNEPENFTTTTHGHDGIGHPVVPINSETGCNTAEHFNERLQLQSLAGVNAGQGGSAAGCKAVCVLQFPADLARIGAQSFKDYTLYVDHQVHPSELAAITEDQYNTIVSLGEGEGSDQAAALQLLLEIAPRLLGKKMLFKSPEEVFFLGIHEDWEEPFVGNGGIGFMLEPLGGIKGIRISKDQRNCEAYGANGETLEDFFTNGPLVEPRNVTIGCNPAELYIYTFYLSQRAGSTAGIGGSNPGCIPACVLQFPDDVNKIGVADYKEYRLYPDSQLDADDLITITQEQNDRIVSLTNTSDALPALIDIIPQVVGQKLFFKTPREIYFLISRDDGSSMLAHGDIGFMLEAIAGIAEIRVKNDNNDPFTASCEAYDANGNIREDFFSGAPEEDDA